MEPHGKHDLFILELKARADEDSWRNVLPGYHVYELAYPNCSPEIGAQVEEVARKMLQQLEFQIHAPEGTKITTERIMRKKTSFLAFVEGLLAKDSEDSSPERGFASIDKQVRDSPDEACGTSLVMQDDSDDFTSRFRYGVKPSEYTKFRHSPTLDLSQDSMTHAGYIVAIVADLHARAKTRDKSTSKVQEHRDGAKRIPERPQQQLSPQLVPRHISRSTLTRPHEKKAVRKSSKRKSLGALYDPSFDDRHNHPGWGFAAG